MLRERGYKASLGDFEIEKGKRLCRIIVRWGRFFYAQITQIFFRFTGYLVFLVFVLSGFRDYITSG